MERHGDCHESLSLSPCSFSLCPARSFPFAPGTVFVLRARAAGCIESGGKRARSFRANPHEFEPTEHRTLMNIDTLGGPPRTKQPPNQASLAAFLPSSFELEKRKVSGGREECIRQRGEERRCRCTLRPTGSPCSSKRRMLRVRCIYARQQWLTRRGHTVSNAYFLTANYETEEWIGKC